MNVLPGVQVSHRIRFLFPFRCSLWYPLPYRQLFHRENCLWNRLRRHLPFYRYTRTECSQAKANRKLQAKDDVVNCVCLFSFSDSLFGRIMARNIKPRHRHKIVIKQKTCPTRQRIMDCRRLFQSSINILAAN